MRQSRHACQLARLPPTLGPDQCQPMPPRQCRIRPCTRLAPRRPRAARRCPSPRPARSDHPDDRRGGSATLSSSQPTKGRRASDGAGARTRHGASGDSCSRARRDRRRAEHPFRIGDTSEAEQQVCQCSGIDMSEPRSAGARIAERTASTVIRVLVVDEHRNPGHGEPSSGASRWPGRQSPKQYTRQPPGLSPGAAGQNTRSIAGLADDRQPESYNNQTSLELAIEQAPGCNRLILSA